MASLLSDYIQLAVQDYPSLGQFSDLENRMKPVISEEILELPTGVLDRAKTAVQKIYNFSRSPEQLLNLKSTLPLNEIEILNTEIKNQSVLMAYDFHYTTETDKLSLIEINTNASAYLVAELLNRLRQSDSSTQLPHPIFSLHKSFQNETSTIPSGQAPKIAIIDENITQQKMLPEFYMYKDLFKKWGWPTEICDYNDLKVQSANFIYNRYTDFTFQRPSSAHLRKVFLERKIIFSPNPKEYILLADKTRLIDFYRSKISETILPIETLNSSSDVEELWVRRKHLFFKPKTSFGSKATYRGSSISRTHFNKIFTGDFIAQELSPPGRHKGWKFDLRFYAYQDEIHLASARIYQGQVTNFSKIGGGFAPIRWC